jgi:hypothetical protein
VLEKSRVHHISNRNSITIHTVQDLLTKAPIDSSMSSSDVPIELSLRDRGIGQHKGPVPLEAQASSEDVPPTPVTRLHLKLLSAGFSFFVAGTNDGSMGALLPYILQDYRIGTSLIAVL